MNFSSKAETLVNLQTKLKNGSILPIVMLAANISDHQFENIFEKSPNWLKQEKVIVRSSAHNEDLEFSSMAGHYSSIANIQGKTAIKKALKLVRNSFSGDKNRDSIFIQPYLQDISICGVVLTRDPSNGSPYYIINYDDTGYSSDSVTGGHGKFLKTTIIAKQSPHIVLPEVEDKIITLAQELEITFSSDSIDIEFAIDFQGKVYLLQVRPLIIQSELKSSNKEQSKTLGAIEKRFTELSKPHPYLLGKKSIFGTMPDWNPAEIIGTHPRPLQLSLYKEIVTDNIWAYQRNNYGYRNLRSFPLLIDFFGLPYIDVRVSFNSFIPADLSPDLAERLVDYYIKQLIDNPSYHDKVEFFIIFSCYSLDVNKKLSGLKEYGFSDLDISMISKSLLSLTNNIIHPERGLWKTDIEKLKTLKKRRSLILESNLTSLEKIYWLLEDCKRYGTLPFAGLARAGFIAVQLLNSLISTGILSQTEHESFLGSLKTVSSQMIHDFKSKNKHDFLSLYGHLRPGTYDILSQRYDENPELYFNWDESARKLNEDKKTAAFCLNTLNKLEKSLKIHGFEHGALSFFNFIKNAIEGREFAKFEFTKNLSNVLQLLEQVGKDYNLSREDMSFFSIKEIQQLYSSSNCIEKCLKKSIDDGREQYKKTLQLKLPTLITRKEDIFYFALLQAEPNYITLNETTAPVANETDIYSVDIRGRIVLIENADPGYDWIFSHGIAGLITKYGGVNSHMAIRSAELNIPAAIGVGDSLFHFFERSETLQLNCLNKQILKIK